MEAESAVCAECGTKLLGRKQYNRRCKQCTTRARNSTESAKERKRRYREKNPELSAQDKRLRRYGLTQGDFDALLKEQNNVCAICKEPMEQPCVDHDHDTGRVRGLLHRWCNAGLEMFREDLDRFAAAGEYLSQHQNMEIVTWNDANASWEDGGTPDQFLVKTVGWVRKEGQWLRVANERGPEGERGITRIPLENVVQRQILEEATTKTSSSESTWTTLPEPTESASWTLPRSSGIPLSHVSCCGVGSLDSV